MRARILVIANPTAGSRHGKRLQRIIDRLKRRGCSIRIHTTRARGDAEQVVRAVDRETVDAIAVAGGDGTINEVLNGLPDDGPPLAILPLGTVNVLAREIGLPRSDDGIADTVAFGPSRPIAIGEANGRRFAMMASVGLDATVVEHVDLALKRRLGRWAYLIETLKQTVARGPTAHRLRLGDRELESYGIIIANGRRYGGRYITAPEADLEKPRLDICRMTHPGRLAVPSYLLSLLLGRFARRADVHIEEATDLEILGPAGAPVQADGDVLCRLPARFRVLPAAVQLIFPTDRSGAV